MPPRTTLPVTEPVELSLEDLVIGTWLEDTGEYLDIDAPELAPRVPADLPPADRP